jgi:Sulfite exporter TauE/SafE
MALPGGSCSGVSNYAGQDFTLGQTRQRSKLLGAATMAIVAKGDAVSMPAMEWVYPLSGFVVGAVVGLTGMGGGSLMTPLLILLFGLPPLTAVGTDLIYAAATKAAGTAIHSRRGNADWKVAALLAVASIPATVLTIWVLFLTPKGAPGTAGIISMANGSGTDHSGLLSPPHTELRPRPRR